MKGRSLLILDDVFSADLCGRLIEAFESNGGFDGGYAGAGGKMVVDHEIKQRRDFRLSDPVLCKEITDLLPEKVLFPLFHATGFQTQNMERFALARYDEGGHFKVHTDDATKETAHRKYAVSVALNGDYDGGTLVLPGRRVKLKRSQAAVFSCSVPHGVMPIVSGKRYVFLPFLY